jgi:hypothetical protein
MIFRLVLRHLTLHPIRSLVFVGAYAAGVSVMLALLSIGEVMVEQSRDEQWIGGGDITIVPSGIDLETLRTGGAVFFGIDQARFIARAVLGGGRLADRLAAVAPWIDDRAVYLRQSGGEAIVALRSNGQIPSAARALGAAPEILSGSWIDSDDDRRWLTPSGLELYSEIDRFHLPPENVRGDSAWAEWHYFNLLWPDEERWLYLSYIVGGDVTGEDWGGIVLARYHTPDGRDRSFADTLAADDIVFSATSAELVLGPHTVRLIDDPVRYRIRARLPAVEGRSRLTVDLDIAPESQRYFPPAQLAAADSFVSGYVVPALRAGASGRVCVGEGCEDVDETIAYHDHNWGTWGGVIWDWGIAHAGPYDVLYGGVHGDAVADARRQGVRFLGYVVDSLGVAAVLEPRELIYGGARPIVFDGDTVVVPEALAWMAVQGPDSLAVDISLENVELSSLTLGGDSDVYFAQMKGTMRLSGILAGRVVAASGPGFFETYLRRRR